MKELAMIDTVFLILLILLVIRGFLRGFVKEFFSLGAPALGILAGFLFHKSGAEFIRDRYLHDVRGIPEILAFIAIFLIVFLICKIIQKIILDVVHGMNLSTLDKVLGSIFGLAEGFLVIFLAVFVITIQPLFDPSGLLQGSFFGKIILPFMESSGGVSNSQMMDQSVFLFFPFGNYPG